MEDLGQESYLRGREGEVNRNVNFDLQHSHSFMLWSFSVSRIFTSQANLEPQTIASFPETLYLGIVSKKTQLTRVTSHELRNEAFDLMLLQKGPDDKTGPREFLGGVSSIWLKQLRRRPRVSCRKARNR